PDTARVLCNLGVALRFKRDLKGSIAVLRQAIEQEPDLAEAHCHLGVALLDQGEFAQALIALKEGHELGSPRKGWSLPSEFLLKGCERLIDLEKRLPDLLRGADEPADRTERLAVARLCAIKRVHRAAARFYHEAFHADPSLAQNPSRSHRFDAA